MNTPGSPLAARGRKLAGVLAAALVGWLMGSPAALAQNINWVGGTSTDWNTAANWSSNAVPTLNNITIDTNSGNQPAVSAGSASENIIVVGNTTASGANTSLTISGGAQFSSGNFLIGNATGSSGAVLVTDAGTVLNTPPYSLSPTFSAQIGVNGTGSLTIANGAVVIGLSVVGNLSAANGTVLVTGDGSLWEPENRFLLGSRGGVANVSFADGGSGTGLLMEVTGSNSSVKITGVAASGNRSNVSLSDRFFVSASNTTLTIANGGQLSATGGIYLSGISNNILVTDPGSSITSGNLPGLIGEYGFYIGQIGTNNQLTIANGASVTSLTNYIGYSTNSAGGVTITGPGSVWNATGNIVVGNATNSTASLTLANGGSINITSGNIILGQNGGNGTLNLNDGAFFQDGNANGSLVLGNNSTINWNGGTMQATNNLTSENLGLNCNMTMTGNGCIFDTNGFSVTLGGVLSGTGSLTKNGNGNLSINLFINKSLYTGATVINGGTLTLNSISQTNITTNITDDATLILTGTTGLGNYTGNLSGNGLLVVQLPLTMTGAGNFTGTIQVSAFPGLTFSGDLSQMGGNIENNGSGQLTFTQNFDTSYAGNISGEGPINKTGSGNLTLSGNVSISPNQNSSVNAGNLTFTGNISQINDSIFVDSGSNLIFNQSFNSSWRGVLGSGNIFQNGSGSLTISGGGFSGIITVSAGSLIFNGVSYGFPGNIINNSAFVFAAPYDNACPAVISGTGTVTINATGNLTLTGSNTYTGITTINSGTLLVDGQLAAASNIQINNGGALGGNGTVLGSVSVGANGSLIPGDNGNTLPDGNDDGGLVPGAGGTIPGPDGNLTFLGTLSINALSLDPATTISFDLTDPGNYSNLSITGPLAETGNVVITLDSGFQAGIYQLISSTGGLSNDFGNVSVTGAYSPVLTDGGGVWTGSTTGVNFAFHAATGQLVVNYTIVPLSPTGNTSFSLSAPGNVSTLAVNGTLAEAGNLVLNLSSNLSAGTYQLFTSNGGFSNDFANVTLTGLYSAGLTDSGGIWTGNISGATFTFNAATGQLTISTPNLAGISATKAAWLEQYFTVPQLVDPTVSGDTADPAGDGISNYMKYALNLNPMVNGQGGLPQISTDGTYLYLYFVPGQTDVNYNIEASVDLINWSSNGVQVYPYGTDLLVGSYPVPANGTAFMRLVVTPSQ